jgi:hypothetical protein
MIIFPMAGLSKRFFLVGYKFPKYMLSLEKKSVFCHAVESFSNYFNKIPFLFIARDINNTREFVVQECKKMGLVDYSVISLDNVTRGQAETVALGISKAKVSLNIPLTIFNIDTFRPNFTFPEEFDLGQIDGYIEVFQGSGSNWSYVRSDKDSKQVIETAEKREISDLCCTGLYHFSQSSLFYRAFEEYSQLLPEFWDANELYVAPLYNNIIKKGGSVKYHLINRDDVIFCGTPSEYELLKLEV